MISSSTNIVGRDLQLDAIRGQLIAMARGERGVKVVFITGEAGIGKSTLLKEVFSMCGSLPVPARVAQVECSTPLMGEDIGEVESLAPWIAVMRELVGADVGAERNTRRLVGELAMAWVRCIPIVGDVLESVADTAKLVKDFTADSQTTPIQAGSQQEIFQQYVNLLGRLSEDVPLVLIIDDFHWADTSSTNLLFTAARGLRDRRVIFLVAYRVDDAASARSGEGHPLLHIRNELERYSLSSEVEVPPLTSLNVDLLLRRRYSNYIDNDEFEEWLVRASDGNALFITQFLDTLEENGSIDRHTGEVFDAYRSAEVPGSARAVLEERIRRLGDDSRELLRYASVEGDLFTTQILGRVSEIPALKLLQRLRMIEEKHRLLRSLGKQRVYASETTAWQFKHWLLQQVMYEGLGEEERELLHEAVLTVLQEELELAHEGEGSIPGIAARLAVHARTIGRPLVAADALLAGAEESWNRYAEQEALRQIVSALDAVATVRATGRPAEIKRADAIEAKGSLLRGRIASHRGRFPEASDNLRRAVELFELLDERRQLVDGLNHLASLLRFQREYDQAVEMARRAGSIAAETVYPKGIAGAHRVCGIVNYLRSDLDAALDEFNAALAIDREQSDRKAEAAGLANIGAVYYLRGDYDQALPFLREGIEISRAIGDLVAEAQLLNNMANIHERRGEDQEALADYERGLEIYRSVGGRAGETTLLNNIGNLFSRRSDRPSHERALSLFQESLAIARESELVNTETRALLGIGRMMLALEHDQKEAEKHLEEARRGAHASGSAQIEAEALGLLGELRLTGVEPIGADRLREGQEFIQAALDLNPSQEEKDRLMKLLQKIDEAMSLG